MIKFAAKLLLFASIFLIYDKIFFIVADLSAKAEVDKRLEYLIKGEINKDVIVIGSSCGSRDIIAEQIENKTGYTTYNLCYPGSDVEFHEFILRMLIKFNKPPKVILLTVDDYTELLDDQAVIFRNDRLYPLVKYPYIRKELIARGEKNKYLSVFLMLHSLNKVNFDLRRKAFTPLDTIIDCGSMPISWKRKGVVWNYITGERVYPIENEMEEKVLAYKEIVKMCNSKDIKLVVIFPPFYKSHSISFESRIRQLSGDHARFYIYNAENPIYRNKDYFFDHSHLMKDAAVIFTDELITFLCGTDIVN